MANKVPIAYSSNGVIWNFTTLVIPGLKSQGFSQTVATKTSDYTLTTTDDIVLCNNVTSMTITLPAATASGRIYNVKNINNSGSVIIDANVGGGTIDGELTQTINSYENITLVDGSNLNWYIL